MTCAFSLPITYALFSKSYLQYVSSKNYFNNVHKIRVYLKEHIYHFKILDTRENL